MNEFARSASRRVFVGDAKLEPLAFAFWSVRPDIVVDNIARYAAETGECIACIEVPGDYERTLGGQFAAGNGPDVFYAQRAEASLWDAQGYLAPVSEFNATFAPSLRRMDERMVAGARNSQGRLLGLTYYNGGPFALFAHRDFADRIDLQGLKDWRAVLDQLRRAQRDGLSSHAFLPRWHRTQTGLVWSLLCHMASEGVLELGAAGAPAALREALAFFQTLAEEELVPAESLDDVGDGAALERWVSGRHVLTFTMDYLAMDAAVRAGTPISVVAARLPGQSGMPLMPGHALLCMKAGLNGPRRERAERLTAYLGGIAPDGELRVHERWLAECLFAVPYPELDSHVDVRTAMARAFPDHARTSSVEVLIAARRGACVSPPTHAPWFLEWSGYCDKLVRNDLLRAKAITAAGAADALTLKWSTLASKTA
jgi:ABC-type glycerol-3-phosphate transport system substrate-binding protein